jgi:hypothetical protein
MISTKILWGLKLLFSLAIKGSLLQVCDGRDERGASHFISLGSISFVFRNGRVIVDSGDNSLLETLLLVI